MTGKGAGRFGSVGNILSLDPCAGHMGIFTLEKVLELHNYFMCTFQDVYYMPQ